MPGSKHYVFTLNNYSAEEVLLISALINSAEVNYVVFGREVAPTTNTPHLQGYIAFLRRKTLAQCRVVPGLARAHFEVARGTPREAIAYCKKDGNFEEFGDIPVGQGHRTDWERLKDWVLELGRCPTRRELASTFPGLFARSERLMEICEAFLPAPVIQAGDPNAWQRPLVDAVIEPCTDDRSILFYVDTEGNKGKSWVCRYLLSLHPERTQILGIGKRDDMAYTVDPSKDIFLIDVPRSQSEFLQYAVLEMMKNRCVMSNKYGSTMKILSKLPHVIVFMNEHPNMESLSDDRYIITEI